MVHSRLVPRDCSIWVLYDNYHARYRCVDQFLMYIVSIGSKRCSSTSVWETVEVLPVSKEVRVISVRL